jgi:hypothetical protein
MDEPALVFATDREGAVELVVNFAVYGGREATPAEIDRLGDALLARCEQFEVVCETRYGFDREHRASVYRIRLELPGDAGVGADEEAVRTTVEDWARDCIDERRLTTP